jgi:hypothetical protein
MNDKTVKLLVFLALLIHGIGHLQGVLSSAGVKFHASTSNQSWLLGGSNKRLNHLVCLVLYLAAALFGILAALSFKGLVIPLEAWTSLALLSAFLSTASLLLFPGALAMFFNKAGAVIVNLIIFYSILFQGNWPAAAFEN